MLMATKLCTILTLRGLTVLPGTLMTFDVGRGKSIKAVEESLKISNGVIFLVAQKDAEEENPDMTGLYKTGTVCEIKNVMRFAEDRLRVIVTGIKRAELVKITKHTEFLRGLIKFEEDNEGIDEEVHMTLVKKLKDCLEIYFRLNKKINLDFKALFDKHKENLDGLVYDTLNIIPFEYKEKQEVFEQETVSGRTEALINRVVHEIEIINIENDIQQKVQANFGKIQKDQYLREQIKVIKNELGEGDSDAQNDEYKKKIETLKFNEELYEKAKKELNRLVKMPSGFAEASVLTNYLDILLELPWNIKSEDNMDIANAKNVLDEDHYGLERVKERILEYLAVRKITGSLKGPVLCLVGPPGVGKTSIARSVAAAVNKKYVRMSLGGIKDESEIRGHRKTYIGAMPGRIINAIKQVGTKNPLILLDEIDKMGSDYRGDPTSAMLEVLDTEQNNTFRDHFLELPFDLSEVLFMCTANSMDGIPRPLLDRMEIIEISSYTEEEKTQIALRHLMPKQLAEHGLSANKVVIEQDTMTEIIRAYTAEAGVRGLERQIAKMCRKIAKTFAESNKRSYKINLKNIKNLLGTKKYLPDRSRDEDEVGVCTGLAWTQIGGVILNIEVNVMQGTGKLELTGHLGDVMKESALAAMSFLRSRMAQLKLEKDFYSKYDIHIHIPEGATPKDGPSAGITLATAMASALTGIPCKNNVAMTGEITLRGRVLPIGGLKEKALAAYRAGIKTIIIPESNIKDLEDIPSGIRNDIKFVAVKNMDEVFKTALSKYNNELYYDIMHINTSKENCLYDNN